jgi:IclR family acetate operon transcriptional repressor
VVAGGAADGVQSLERAFVLLELMADAGGEVAISRLAVDSGLPVSTIHRLVRTLVGRGYVRQVPSRRYVLGPRLIHLGECSSRTLATWAQPHLTRLVDAIGETANLAMLDGSQVAYVAQVPSRHAMRMFTEVGKRVMPHCTAVGKALLLGTPADELRLLLQRNGMPRRTDMTITDPDVFVDHLAAAARAGYAIDDGEQEIGVRCVAVPVSDAPVRLALSISGPAPRMTPELVERAVPLLQEVAAGFAADLT